MRPVTPWYNAMAIRLHTSAPDFESRFRTLLSAKREASEDVDQTVRQIIADVRSRGDAALSEMTLRFDRIDLAERGMRVSEAEIDAAFGACEEKTLAALRLARDRLEEAQVKLLPADHRATDDLGVESGVRWTAVESAGLYVPGGTAAYPSSVLMNAVPARVAGCDSDGVLSRLHVAVTDASARSREQSATDASLWASSRPRAAIHHRNGACAHARAGCPTSRLAPCRPPWNPRHRG